MTMEEERMLPGRIAVVNNLVQIAVELNETPATLVIPKHPALQIRVDGVELTGRVQIHAFSEVDVHLVQTEPTRDMRIFISPDNLLATLEIVYTDGKKTALQDAQATPTCVLQVVEDVVKPHPFTLADVLAAMTEKRISMDFLNSEEIQDLLSRESSGTCACARGEPPTEGLPERFEILVKPQSDPVFGIVPVRPILTVRSGVLVARRLLAEPGTPGTSVFGTTIAPYTPAVKVPKVGQGLAEDSERLLHSTRGGRVIVRSDLVDVAPTMEFAESLSARHGHVHFDGDIVVYGDVEEGVEVVAGGVVFIRGHVSSARVIGDAGVTIGGGVFQSKVLAGMRHKTLHELEELLEELADDWESLEQSAERLEAALRTHGAEVPLSRVVASLLADKFQAILEWPRRLQEFAESRPALDLGPWQGRLKLISSWLTQVHLESTAAAWASFQEQIDKWRTVIREWEQATELASIQVAHGQMSDLEATGDIDATVQGFYHCQVHAGGTVRALGRPGVLVGSEIVAGSTILARIVGSPAEALTTLKIPEAEHCYIKADCVYPGSVFLADEFRHEFLEESRNCQWPT
ncbi:MAG: FapA family protein [Alicyclobacillaceae bacterium]|nr:FapA family protein [Alicyclobacillaceae bacterium]